MVTSNTNVGTFANPTAQPYKHTRACTIPKEFAEAIGLKIGSLMKITLKKKEKKIIIETHTIPMED